MRKNTNLYFLAVFVLAVFLPAGGAFSQGEPLINIGGISYINIDSFSRTNGLRYLWDPVAKNALVTGKSGRVRFHVGSEYILSQEKLFNLGNRVRFFKGSVIAPLAAQEYLNNLFFEKKAVFSQPVLPQLSSAPSQLRPLSSHRIRTIVIDAGHGGFDSGAVSPHGTREKDIVFDIAKRVRSELEARGIQVIMTRNQDIFIPLSERARTANKKTADFFVSIHANASFSKTQKGLEVYHLSETTDDGSLAVERAENSVLKFETVAPEKTTKDIRTIVWDLKESENRKESIRIGDDILNSVPQFAPVSSKKLRSANFYVLKWTRCPSVLVEAGYLTNFQDENRLKSSIYRQHLAEGIVKGLMNYKSEFERTDGFTR